MEAYYPYTVIPEKVKSIMNGKIPLPNLPKLISAPEKVKRRYIGTVLFVLFLIALIIVNIISSSKFAIITYILFFATLISFVAMIFEFVQYSKLKKHYAKELKYYEERQKAYSKVKQEIEKIEQDNKIAEKVKNYRQKEILAFFASGYDTINAVHNEYSLAKSRLKLFLEEYFPDEILDNIKVLHRAKKINYVPDFVIQFEKPKINIAIEIEEPYSLSNVPENIQKDYEAKDRLRQRFANELGWLVIIIAEEQSVLNPAQCCKYIEDSMASILHNIKRNEKFASVKSIDKQKMLTGKERAELKANKYRETYLRNAGLMDNPSKEKTISERVKKPGIQIDKSKEKDNTQTQLIRKYTSNASSYKKTDAEQDKKFVESKNEKNDASIEAKNTIDQKHNKVELSKNISKTADTNEIKKDAEKEVKNVILDSKKENETSKNIANEIKSSINTDKKETITTKPNSSVEKDETRKDKLTSFLNERKERETKTQENIPEDDKKLASGDNDIDSSKNDSSTSKDAKSIEEIIRRRKEDIRQKLKKTTGEESFGDKKSETKNINQEDKLTKTEARVEKPKDIEDKKEAKGLQNITKIEKTEVKKEQIKDKVEKPAGLISDNKKEELKEKLAKVINKEEKESEKNDNKISHIEKTEKEPTSKSMEYQVLETKKDLKKKEEKQILIESYREQLEKAVLDKEWNKLIELCNEAIKEVPFWGWAYYRRSTAYGHKREYEKVVSDCGKAIGYNPTLAEAYYNRGTARFFLQKFMNAAEDYDKAILLKYAKQEDAHFNKGLCLLKLEHRKKAFQEFNKAKELGSEKAAEILKQQFNN